MNEFVLIDEDTGNKKHFDSRSEAEDMARDLPGEYRIESANGEEPEPKQGSAEDIDNRTPDDVEVIDHGNTEGMDMSPEEIEKMKEGYEKQEERYNLPDQPPVDTDPLEWIPSEFQDNIGGTIAINRKGFEVLAHHYGISGKTEMVVSPVETDGEYCVHKAVAQDENGVEYSAYGEAYREGEGNDMVRMSDTRAFKRAVSRATGTGMIAVEELQNEL